MPACEEGFKFKLKSQCKETFRRMWGRNGRIFLKLLWLGGMGITGGIVAAQFAGGRGVGCAMGRRRGMGEEPGGRQVASSRDRTRPFNRELSGGGSRGFGLLAGLGFGASRLARGFGGFLEAIDVSKAAAAFLDFIILFTHKVSPPS